MKSSPAISIVVPAYNEEASIARLLESLAQQTTRKPFEVIVVNNASTDRTREIAEKFSQRLNLRVIDEPQKGRGAARATGFDQARGNIIFSTDADSIVPPNWLEAFAEFFEDPAVVAVTGVGRTDDLSFVQNIVHNALQPLATFFFKFLYGARWLVGFNFAIRKNAYQQAGGFNRDLNALEDLEIGIKAQRVGKVKMVWFPAVTVSGRRYKNSGIVRGLWQYVALLRQYREAPTKTILNDQR